MPKLLVIDDEENVGRIMHRLLRQILPNEWDVLWEPVPSTGLSILVLDPLVSICIVDLLLRNGMDGDEIVEEALKLRPEMRGRIIVCSGMEPDQRIAHRLFEELGCLRVDKPVDLQLLQRILWQLIFAGSKVP